MPSAHLPTKLRLILRRPATLAVALVFGAPFARPSLDPVRAPIPRSVEADSTQPGRWEQALDGIIGLLRTHHPDLFARIGHREFAARADRLRRELPRLDDRHAVVRLMQLVAGLEDGHTQLEPVDEPAFNSWYPIRFYRFPEGVFVTTVARPLASIAGGRVLRIGGLPADEALARAESVMSGDNPWGRMENLFALSNAAMLYGLGVTPDADSLPLDVVTSAGTRHVVLHPVAGPDGSFDGRFRGEMFPPFRDTTLVWATAFGGRSPMQFRQNDPALPLSLRYRLYYFLQPLPANDALYTQINFMQEDPSLGFTAFTDSLLRTLARRPVNKLIIDLRYNSGGNGALVPGFADALIRAEPKHLWRQLYVLTGRKTFSAAILLVAGIRRADPGAVIVGEPAGAGLNHAGDPMGFPVPGTGMVLSVSTVVHQETSSEDPRPYVPVNLPVEQTAAQYFAGRDPALDLILGPDDTRDVVTIAQTDGPTAAGAVLRARQARYGDLDWWSPYDERAMNSLGYQILRTAHDAPRAAATFALNTAAFPESWNAWDSYGEALADAGRVPEAVAAYRHSLALNPGNGGARDFIAKHGGDAH